MRTTIEISPEHRTRLMELAARRGEKGFSKLVQQALDAYLKSQTGEEEKRRHALMLKGADPDDGDRAPERALREESPCGPRLVARRAP